jgi:hypothetical protein
MQPFRREPRGEEVPVVHQRVADARLGQVGGELGLPHPLGEPEAARVHPEAVLHGLMHPAYLLHPIAAGQRSQHGLIEAREQDLHLAVRRERAEPVEIRGLVRLEPLEQRPGQVQHDG